VQRLVCSILSFLVAYVLTHSFLGIQQYFKIKLEKNIPIQAGLGGGSGNAATAMHAFNVLLNYPASLDQLRLWSGDIGSDITFFFSSGTAYCTGRGEIVESLPVSRLTHKHTNCLNAYCTVHRRCHHRTIQLFIYSNQRKDCPPRWCSKR